ncbi:MAG: nuclear transport factor 2 family protein [Chitinophagaceae bacterium]|nr:nuclear transport factor 2 family protein [Chitinophagaceae bacterium]MBK7679788.1 nuclear transport factor 2 family protein [Chitinophagaceae bacterium]MBK8298859.1 nuclear transport factor 2 family protein [Chitinophagaceae bacterium]MBK9938113.1 nuclear transport factor 2 family protein [Chitinophagaceae bacterium]MBL0067950.1 nuclear transport factor 2 family protein [Chitinophagaceae bacterium]
MEVNKQVIENFYTAFQQLDYTAMNSCYSDEIVFSDPAFGFLRGEEVKYMWEMLCKNAKDFSLTFSNIQLLDDEYATCNWVATYTFSKTGRKVVNHIKAFMKLKDGKIIEHSDAFKLSKWAAQALGFKGELLGWTGFMKRKIQKNARMNLIKFIEAKGE